MRPTRPLLIAALLAASLPSTFANQTVLERRANEAFGLSRSDVVQLSVAGAPGTPIAARFDVGTQPVLLQLAPRSVRGENYQLIEHRADGSYVAVDPGPIQTMRGEIVGIPGSHVAASFTEDGLYAYMTTTDGTEYWIQPMRDQVEGAKAEHHVLFRSTDVLDDPRPCGTDFLPDAIQNLPADLSGGGDTFAVSTVSTAEIGADADYEYYQDYGNSSTNVGNRIETVINTMNLQYESQVGITHVIPTTLVRTSSNQPYTSTGANGLLDQLQAQWNSNHSNITRDIVHLFTGKEIDGGTIGIAYIGVICNQTYGYGLVQSDFNNNLACTTDLSAHELGHNWDAGHCNCSSNTMNAFITCANSFHSSFTIPEILSHRDSRSCLDSGPGPDPDPVTSVRVSAISVGQQNLGQGNKRGVATVTIVDNNGDPVAGAAVTGTFSEGTVSGTSTVTTDASGQATLVSNTRKGRIRFTFCVDDVVLSPLSYDEADNTVTCRTR